MGGRRAARRAAGTVAGLAVALTVLVLVAGPAAAHAELRSSDPADGDVLETAPGRITLDFTEEVDVPGDAIQVLASTGDTVDIGSIQRSDSEVSAELPPLEDGSYVVSWRVLSTDSHPITGGFRFQVGAASAADEEAAAALLEEMTAGSGGAGSLGVVYGVARFVAFAGMVVLVGGALFVAGIWRDGTASTRARAVLGTGWLALLLATIATIGLQAGYATGGSWADTIDAGSLGDVLATQAGRAWLVRLALLVVVFVAWRRLLPRLTTGPEPSGAVRPPHLATVGLLGLGLVATVSFAGHAASGELVPLALLSDIVHLTGVSFWLGGLTVLSLVVLRGSPAPQMAMARSLSAARAVPSSMETGESSTPGNRDGDGDRSHGEESSTSGSDGHFRGGQAPWRVVRQFSSLAFAAVITIAATGTFLGWRQSRSLEAVTDTTYGRLLLSKLGLVAVILVGATVSRLMVRRWTDRPDSSLKVLRRSVGVEALVAVGVLAVTSGLVNTVPAKDSLAPGVFEEEVHGSTLAVQVTVDPPEVGLADVSIEALTHDGEPLELVEVSLLLSLPEKSISDLPATLEPEGPGRYVATGTDIPFAGTWQLEVVAKTSDVSQERLAVDVPIS